MKIENYNQVPASSRLYVNLIKSESSQRSKHDRRRRVNTVLLSLSLHTGDQPIEFRKLIETPTNLHASNVLAALNPSGNCFDGFMLTKSDFEATLQRRGWTF